MKKNKCANSHFFTESSLSIKQYFPLSSKEDRLNELKKQPYLYHKYQQLDENWKSRFI